ncbi:hypothetical protein PG996_005323 [Apiospora saccharicola]|uniref:Heterokaryon incompatibility domain-containing protein n=1 Tax=Apiospora saccharicola TaxID=335842 RepID=A0ABR1VP37_9PEZI
MNSTVAKTSEGAPSQIDLEALRLKRELVADDFKGHSCENCGQIRVPTPPLSYERKFFHIDTSRTKIQSLATSGCNFWGMIQDQLSYIDLKTRIERNGRYIGLQELGDDAKLSEEHREYLTATVGESDAKEFLRLCHNRVETWRLSGSEEGDQSRPRDFVRVSVWHHSRMYFNDGPVTVYVEFMASKPSVKAASTLDRGGRNTVEVYSTDFLALAFIVPESPKAIGLVRQWILKCEVEHTCGINDRPETLPSMVLDVSDQHKVKLIQAPTIKERYITLSYCWGKTSQAVMLNQNNMSDLSSDDGEFKTKELGKMGNIYRNATFTIVASAAKDVRAGFLGRRVTTIDGVAPADGQPHRVFEMVSETKETETSTETLPVILRPETRNVTEPWYERAWTLQELLFSRRRLQYHAKQTTWTCYCSEIPALECDGWLRHMDRDDYGRGLLSDIIALLRKSHDPPQASTVLWYWRELVQVYSRRELTYLTDRLPAISGIEKEFASVLGDQYICGLLMSNLA